ncbi:quinol:electron acceptor oxidoreductase subunit ActD [Geobacter sp. DSM 9736]|uniref:quinol:electron acceptor oxidoreductase subunit ActD n=1 Tax=Geobacter sp. DSM 9736 TaxID=1277350 RepID=UPI000B50D9F3|nr:quinol:electron acceptor oxidoreductase subunit ActD [Geobacter sp. DSM 9736]SNB46689.1 prokaryotic molybdopterin-containing oxidoreductase family, membrane subunit [Geobacter sp. DSM 9736]
MPELNYGQINDDVLVAMRKPHLPYLLAISALAAVIGLAALAWLYQMRMGMGVTGLNNPVGWATYIGNFVFWVGIAHSGTLISAILYLLRANWRDAVSRSSEAMTIFAVMTAGLFPIIHLGRTWVFYYIIPYPSQRQIWPTFMSPLIWDVCAVTTYFTVSLIFWFVGLIPDMAAARDRYEAELGRDAFRSRLYRLMALGWSGTGRQWHHYGRSYLFFAALATPLVISVHSVVSWDFAISNLPGWHSTIFPPYFVAGAIHSGLAMVLTLLIPMRKLLKLERLITPLHFEAIAKTIILTASIVGYAYAMEVFIAWYSGDVFEWQLYKWRMTGDAALIFWLLIPFNVLIPLLFVFKRVRTNMVALFVISLIINIGMWLERVFLVVTSLAHDFLPHNWGTYFPTWVEVVITTGSFAFFFFWFFGFSKLLPTVPLSDLKMRIADEEIEPTAPCACCVKTKIEPGQPAVLALFSNAGRMVQALKAACDGGFGTMETFSPVKVDEAEKVMTLPKSPVRFWTLGGALCGLVGGFWLAIGTGLVNSLIVGGKPAVSIIPYCVVGFEGTILLGSLGNFLGLLFHTRLFRMKTEPYYDTRFSRDMFGLLVSCKGGETERLQQLLAAASPEEMHVHR